MPPATAKVEQGTPWTPGAAVGRYSLVAKLAVGGMAEIWLARQAGLRGFEKVVVIKRISEAFSSDPEFVEMFLDEARIAAQLNHPNIVQIYDLGEDSGSFYIAMEYLPGENLAAIMRAGLKQAKPLPYVLAARVVAGAAEALAHAHAKTALDGKPLQVVHRDVSPQNLIVTYEGGVKVVDFGIAKAANRATHTVGSQLKGKVSYLSPEQARSQDVDGRSDVFSLGIVLFELVTRSRLFAYDDAMKALSVIGGTDPFPAARDRNPEIPETLEALIDRALERDVTRRPSAKDFQLALEEWLRAQPDPSATDDLAEYMGEIFKERIAQRAHLFDQALKGDLTPSRIGSGLIPGGSHPSMPGATRMQIEAAQAKTRARRLLFALVGLVAVGVAAFFGWRAANVEPASTLTPVDVQTEPAGAQVSVDGAKQGTAPLSFELPPGAHEVMAQLTGYQAATRVVRLNPGAEPVHLTLMLVAQTPPPPAPPPVVAAPPPPVAAAAPAPKSAPVRNAPPAKKAAPGKLTLNTTPWTRVMMNGRELGETPLVDIPLPAGRHVLQLVNEPKGIQSAIEVEIEPGKTTTKKLKL